ncbi:MAG TPA: zf-HC2 domain-containing protein [Myxococcales bacterium]|nr:zf-HC2 domain-containing protein [Myxococcales bacterium]
MTHAESQDLLLDLAYGELDPPRAAEVERHLSSCPECRKEKAALDEARRMAAPVRELEEPPPGFDERILRAARAQAQLEHDGNVGQVIEVTGTVRPLGVDVARIDAHAPVKARSPERRRPRWVVRTAVAGSVAAAAALALVVGNTLETRRMAERAAAARTSDFEIRVQPAAPQAVDSALRDAEAKQDNKGVPAKELESPPVAAPSKEKTQVPVALPALRKRALPGVRMQGSGGDAAESRAKAAADARKEPSRPVEDRFVVGGRVASTGNLAQEKLSESPPASPPSAPASAPAPAPAPAPPSRAAEPPPAGVAVAARQDMPRPMAAAKAPIASSAAEASLGASAMEANAQQARHAANYLVAASLYREAAAIRQRGNDLGSAAWNLAHAIECLSAAGQFDEARRVRDELVRLYPSETSALAAAARALREVDVPAARPAANDRQR